MNAWYYRKNGKPFRDVIKYLGSLKNHEIEHYKKSVACMNNENGCNTKKLETFFVALIRM